MNSFRRFALIATLLLISSTPAAQTSAAQKPVWWTTLDTIPDRQATTAGYPDLAVDERNAYVLKQGEITARELTTGRTVWRARGSRQVLADGSRVFTFSSDRLMALDARNGRTIWSVRYDHPYPSLYISRELLLGYGIAIYAKTGATRWKINRDNLWGSDGGLVGAADAYIVWQIAFSSAYSGDAFRLFRRSDGQERMFDKQGVYTSQSFGFDTRGRFFELFVLLKEPLSPLPLELRRYDLATATASDTYGKFDVNPRPGCDWTIQVNWFAYRLVGLTAENIVLATEDGCGKYGVVIPSSLSGSTNSVPLPLSVEARQELLGESRGVAVARANENLIQLVTRSGEVLALFDKPLRFEVLGSTNGRVRAARELPFPTKRTAGQDVVWMLSGAVAVANGNTVGVFPRHF